MYTSVSKVREISGFDDTTKISDAVVRGKITRATSAVDGALAYRYDFPLPYHRQNTLTFGGEGAGSGTMAIIINGTTFNISIMVGLTASGAADLFRNAAIDADDFSVDSIGSGVEVLIISKTDSADITTANAEANITAAPTTQGITGSIGTRSDRQVPYIDELTATIAAMMLMTDNYGVEAEDSEEGAKRQTEAITIELQRLQGTADDGIATRLIDEVTKTELTTSTKNTPEYKPNDTTDADTNDSTKAKITINKAW